MKPRSFICGFIMIFFIDGCVSVSKKMPNLYDIEVGKFSSSIKLLLDDVNFLKQEILKINASKPSIQRILLQADLYWESEELRKANAELERALRISKDESALYLRLAHLRLEQGLRKESAAFASRGLLNQDASSWEILLLKIYSFKE